MITILQGLPSISFTENLPDIIIGEVTKNVLLTVQVGGIRYVEDFIMFPNLGKITICTRKIVRVLQSLASPSNPTIKSLPLLNITLKTEDGTIKQNCSLIPGGTEPLNTDLTQWLSQNFLTWQPQIIETTPTQPQWLAFAGAALYQTVDIRTTLYSRDGQTKSKTIANIQDVLPRFHQLPTDFRTLWQPQCEQEGIDPYCYDVFGVGRNSIATTEVQPALITPPDFNRPYPQRYMLRPPRYNDVCFGFENTLSGFDTLMAEGKQTLQPEGDITTFRSNERETELLNDYTSIWEANTGLIESERMAIQFQDFFKSTNRWVMLEGKWSRIVLTEYKVKHYRGEPNSYTFKYRLAEKNERRYHDRVELSAAEPPMNGF